LFIDDFLQHYQGRSAARHANKEVGEAMKSIKVILAIWLVTSAWAQTLPPKQTVNPLAAAQPSGVRTLPTVPQSTKVSPENIQAKPSPGSAKAPAARTSGQFVRGSGRPGGKHGREKGGAPQFSASRTVTAGDKPGRKGSRDPFVSPIVERFRNTAPCTGSGRQCLEVGDISLHGVVRTHSGFIAVVMNGEHTYFLHVNDSLADGAVARITSDAITLRQRSSDALGRPLMREVTRKLGAPAA
jgi:hypothetical protein